MVNYTKHQHISSLSATSTLDGVKDGADNIHSGIIKALELAAAGTTVLDYGSSVFQQTAGSTRTQFGVSGAIKYMREGVVTSATPSAVELGADPDTSNDRYDMIVIQVSDGNFAVRQGTADSSPRVPDKLTAGDIPVALVKVTAGAIGTKNATDRLVQLYGFDKSSNSINIGYDSSGYTEAGNITGSASGLLYSSGLTTVGAVLTMATNEPSVVNNDVLGRINFQAPLDTGADSDLVGASIAAVAQDTFSDTVNSTALIFQTGKSETATTKMIIDEDGNVGIGTASPDSLLEISKDTDAELIGLKLTNQSDAADTTGKVSIQFDLEDTGGNAVDSGKIQVLKEQSFTATGSTQDSAMVLSTSLNGTLTEAVRITSDGKLRVAGNVIQASDGGTTITMDTDDNVTVGGAVTATTGLVTNGYTSLQFEEINYSGSGPGGIDNLTFAKTIIGLNHTTTSQWRLPLSSAVDERIFLIKNLSASDATIMSDNSTTGGTGADVIDDQATSHAYISVDSVIVLPAYASITLMAYNDTAIGAASTNHGFYNTVGWVTLD